MDDGSDSSSLAVPGLALVVAEVGLVGAVDREHVMALDLVALDQVRGFDIELVAVLEPRDLVDGWVRVNDAGDVSDNVVADSGEVVVLGTDEVALVFLFELDLWDVCVKEIKVISYSIH